MAANYSPLDIDAFQKKHRHESKSTVLFIIIGILSMVVVGLLVYLLMKQSVL